MKYKVNDRVRVKSHDWYNENKTTHGDIWFDNAVFVGGQSLYCGCELTIRLVTDDSYYVIENDYYWTDEMIEGLVEDEVRPKYEDEVELVGYSTPKYLVCPYGYQFKDENGNIINATKIVLEKKKKEYPKTFEECVHVLEGDSRMSLEQMNTFRRLIDARNAYWKIAGEEMGLDGPWEPTMETAYCISRNNNVMKCSYRGGKSNILEFPTPEMRDAFKDNFGPDIEFCKEFL